MSRCVVCGNLEQYCMCAAEREAKAREDWPYEKAKRGIILNYSVMRSWSESDLTPTDFLIDRLGGDPAQNGLWLCPKCGVTIQNECAYGGWHDEDCALDAYIVGDSDDDRDD